MFARSSADPSFNPLYCSRLNTDFFWLTAEKTQLCRASAPISDRDQSFCFFCTGPQNQTPIGGFAFVAGSDVDIQNKE